MSDTRKRVDPMAPVPIMSSSTIDEDLAHAALLTLADRGALDLAPMLGLADTDRPRTGHMKPARRAKAQKASRHGTRAGFQAHKDEPCEACKQANRDYMRQHQASRYDPAKRRATYLAAKERGYYAKGATA